MIGHAMNNCNCESTITVYRGASFSQAWRWGIAPLIYKTISAVPQLTPLTLTVTAHGVPPGWSIALTDVACFRELNAKIWPPEECDFIQATVLDVDTIALNSIDAARMGSYVSGGSIAYYSPVDLTSATASFDIYPNPAIATVPVPTLSVAATVDNTGKTITVALTPTNIAALPAADYLYVLRVTAADTTVTIIDSGKLSTKTPGSSQ